MSIVGLNSVFFFKIRVSKNLPKRLGGLASVFGTQVENASILGKLYLEKEVLGGLGGYGYENWGLGSLKLGSLGLGADRL